MSDMDTSANTSASWVAAMAASLEDDNCGPAARLLRALLAERDGANALIDRMHEQDVLAIKQWQAAHPGNDLQWPGQTRLTAWLMGEAAKVQAERDAAQAEAARLREAWLDVIQSENACRRTGKPCDAKRCGCAAEQEMLIKEVPHG